MDMYAAIERLETENEALRAIIETKDEVIAELEKRAEDQSLRAQLAALREVVEAARGVHDQCKTWPYRCPLCAALAKLKEAEQCE